MPFQDSSTNSLRDSSTNALWDFSRKFSPRIKTNVFLIILSAVPLKKKFKRSFNSLRILFIEECPLELFWKILQKSPRKFLHESRIPPEVPSLITLGDIRELFHGCIASFDNLSRTSFENFSKTLRAFSRISPELHLIISPEFSLEIPPKLFSGMPPGAPLGFTS